MGPAADPAARLDPPADLDEELDQEMTEEQESPEIAAQRAYIEQTRVEMTGTIAEIADRLNPQVLMEQAKETVHEVTADVTQQAKETVREMVQDAKDATIGR